jgi:microcystin degradation protein MlrC
MAAEDQHQALAASMFVGFPNADVANAGLSVVVCTTNGVAAATQRKDA